MAQSKYPSDIHLGFSFLNENPTYKAVFTLLQASIESEVASALSKENKGEDRAWYAGRAEALMSFKTILESVRQDVLQEMGYQVAQSTDGSNTPTT